MIDNKELMSQARKLLKGRWLICVIATVIAFLINISIQDPIIKEPLLSLVITLIISGPINLGFSYFYLSIVRGGSTEISKLFSGFKNFKVALFTYIQIFVLVALGMMLLIVPGIMIYLSYMLTYYILVDEPEMSSREAMKKSKKMMYGNKLRAFYLCCRFIGWGILSILTCGIGLFWLIPYISTTIAKFYEDLKSSGDLGKGEYNESDPSFTI